MTLTLTETVQSPAGRRLDRLSQRELEVLRLIAEGLSNAAIAGDLFVSVGTVEKRSASIFSKLDVAEEPDVNRRVTAVLVYLRESAGGRSGLPAGDGHPT